MKTICVCGYGMVGKPLVKWLREKGHSVSIYDPPLGHADERALVAETVFICVPTPTSADGVQDLTAVVTVLGKIPHSTLVVLKSTVLPGTTRRLSEFFGHTLPFNPEFLEEKFAERDFYNPARQIVGFVCEPDDSVGLAHSVLSLLPRGSVFHGSVRAEEAEMVKYFSNCFYAMKVTFAQQMFDLCQKTGIRYDGVQWLAEQDLKIAPKAGPKYLEVPFEGKRGYYGTCLPKDMKALIGFAQRYEANLTMLEAADWYNDKLVKPG